eukprot:scaffold13039_cov24-Prasinocladus_malaysianus.AAC.1
MAVELKSMATHDIVQAVHHGGLAEALGKLRGQPHISGAFQKGSLLRQPATVQTLSALLLPLKVLAYLIAYPTAAVTRMTQARRREGGREGQTDGRTDGRMNEGKSERTNKGRQLKEAKASLKAAGETPKQDLVRAAKPEQATVSQPGQAVGNDAGERDCQGLRKQRPGNWPGAFLSGLEKQRQSVAAGMGTLVENLQKKGGSRTDDDRAVGSQPSTPSPRRADSE